MKVTNRFGEEHDLHLMTLKGSKIHDSKDDGGPLCRWAGHSYEATYYPTRKPVNCKDCLAKTN